MDKKCRCGAVVLAAGSGKRMNSQIKKQFLMIQNKPVIYYALKAFQDSFVDEIVLVVSKEDITCCREEIVERYGLTKVTGIILGGRERYHSVAAGICALKTCDYVFIHDGARPVLTQEILIRALKCVQETNACVAGMPVKDTIKIADENGFIAQTPNRNRVWMIQTPQVFGYELIKEAYQRLLSEEEQLQKKGILITDDAMVVENLMNHPVKLIEGSYQNIKITTPEDFIMIENFHCFDKDQTDSDFG